MDELVRKIRELNDSGLFTKGKISEMTGVSISSVKRICSKSYDKVMERRVARKLADEEFDKLVIKYLPLSNSYNHLCTYLGLRGVEGYYNKIKKVIEKYNLSTDHFGTIKVQSNSCYRNKYTKMSNDEFFVENSRRGGSSIINRLISCKIKEYKCEECGLTKWLDKPIRLQIHHINGIHTDNRLENLQILCPNCHAQTDTYAANNKNKVKTNSFKILNRINEIVNDLECSHIGHRKFEVDSEQLIEDIKTLKSFKKVGDKYGVSDNAIKKRCVKLGIYDVVKKYITSRKRKQ